MVGLEWRGVIPTYRHSALWEIRAAGPAKQCPYVRPIKQGIVMRFRHKQVVNAISAAHRIVRHGLSRRGERDLHT